MGEFVDFESGRINIRRISSDYYYVYDGLAAGFEKGICKTNRLDKDGAKAKTLTSPERVRCAEEALKSVLQGIKGLAVLKSQTPSVQMSSGVLRYQQLKIIKSWASDEMGGLSLSAYWNDIPVAGSVSIFFHDVKSDHIARVIIEPPSDVLIAGIEHLGPKPVKTLTVEEIRRLVKNYLEGKRVKDVFPGALKIARRKSEAMHRIRREDLSFAEISPLKIAIDSASGHVRWCFLVELTIHPFDILKTIDLHVDTVTGEIFGVRGAPFAVF